MSPNKPKKVKVYRYVSVTRCKECGCIPEIPGPCYGCEKKIFVRELEIEEVK